MNNGHVVDAIQAALITLAIVGVACPFAAWAEHRLFMRRFYSNRQRLRALRKEAEIKKDKLLDWGWDA